MNEFVTVSENRTVTAHGIFNRISYWKLGKEYGIEASIIRRWGYAYATFGESGLEKHNSDLCNYSAEFKQQVVTEYLEGKISIQDRLRGFSPRQ